MVLNVVNFPERTSCRRKSATRSPQERAVADISGLVSRFRGLESKAKRELREAIFLLDLTASRVHQLIKTIGDPALKKPFEDDLGLIEELLQIAREKTMRL